jgi:hypothetical protein
VVRFGVAEPGGLVVELDVEASVFRSGDEHLVARLFQACRDGFQFMLFYDSGEGRTVIRIEKGQMR